jgi:hypothetical protein
MSTNVARVELRDITTYDAEQAASALEHILATGDLAELTPAQRVAHYLSLCRSLGLNSLSRPFDWLILDQKLVLYPNKSATEQLRRRHQISVRVLRRELVGDLFVCEVEGRTPDGRLDQSSKYVPITGYSRERGTYRLTGTLLANAFAKAETGAKRRLALSMVGLAGLPDADEAESVRVVTVDAHGNVLDDPSDEEKYLAENPRDARAIGAETFESVVNPADLVETTASQDVRPEELERPKVAAGPRPSFRASDDDVKRWLGAWFAIVKGTSLDTDTARHGFVQAYTDAEWPASKRTASLETFYRRCGTDDAAVFLQHVRTVVEAEKAELLADADAARAGDDDDGTEPF